MGCSAPPGDPDHRLLDRGLSRDERQSRLQRLEDRRGWADADARTKAWAENGVRVNGIAPGLVDTKMTKVTTANPKRLEGALERIPLKRLGRPVDMAGTALFLASPLSSYVIGQTIVVDGGLIL